MYKNDKKRESIGVLRWMQGIARRNKKRGRRDNSTAIETKPQIRPLGMIVVFGPQNRREQSLLEEFKYNQDVFLLRFFEIRLDRIAILQSVRKAIPRLQLTEGLYRHAIMRQGKPDADRLLGRIASDALKYLHSQDPSKPAKPNPTKPKEQGSAKSRGFGGFLNDCCQKCGGYLGAYCYSRHGTTLRVPNRDKICWHCYEKLSTVDQVMWHRHKYKDTHEPRGTGWNPNKR